MPALSAGPSTISMARWSIPDWALKAGLTPENRIAQEAIADNPYRNFIAVREADAKEPWVAKLVARLPESDGQGGL